MEGGGRTRHGNRIERELAKARDQLLDLTLRNKLLNFRTRSKSAVRVVDEVPREVYGRLVLEEKTMAFKHRPDKLHRPPGDSDCEGESDGSAVLRAEERHSEPLTDEQEENRELWRLDDSQLEGQHQDRYLQTDLTDNELARRLFAISHKAQEVMEEQGYSVLYLALDFLEWNQREDEERTYLAPLILIPIELQRLSAGRRFNLKWTGEEIFTNVSLKARLSRDFGVELPEFSMPEDRSGIQEYSMRVAAAVRQRRGWRVTSDIWLGFFSFTRFVMWRDLDEESWPADNQPADHPLIAKLFGQDAEKHETDSDEREDERQVAGLPIAQVNHVMDADASQVIAIEKARAGSNLVVVGPPGTGKSQTITNMIAELLLAGKTVLFVSEKMAALEVVKRRLDGCGLGDGCLELHSKNTNKKVILRELERTLSAGQPERVEQRADFEKYERFRSELNGYAEALCTPLGQFGLTPYALYGMRERALRHFRLATGDMPRIELDSVEQWTEPEYNDAVELLRSVSSTLPQLQPLRDNPWRACTPTAVTQSDVSRLIEQVNECRASVDDLRAGLAKMADGLRVSPAQRPDELDCMRDCVGIVAFAPECCRRLVSSGEYAAIGSDSSDECTRHLRETVQEASAQWVGELLDDLVRLQRNREQVSARYRPQVDQHDPVGLRSEFNQQRQGWPRLFRPDYWRTRRKLQDLYRRRPRLSDRGLVADLDQWCELNELRLRLPELEDRARSLFGVLWCGEESTPDELRRAAKWLARLFHALEAGRADCGVIKLVRVGVDSTNVRQQLADMDDQASRVDRAVETLVEELKLDYEEQFGAELPSIEYAQWQAALKRWSESRDFLARWSQWRELSQRLAESQAAPLTELIASDVLARDDVLPAFEGVFADAMLGVAFKQWPSLRTFMAEVHEALIQDFRMLDTDIIAKNRQRLAGVLWERSRSAILQGASPESEKGILQGQLARKRGHLPIRQLLSRCARPIQMVKPCFMMSPLSVAQYLEPGAIRFDVVIFDEASQVKPHEALGAVMRGDQLVVMGDPKQLPPTSFFDNVGMGEEDEEEEDYSVTTITDVESILKQCERVFPSRTLSWHYRSQHETLIAVSNHQFYDNKLWIYPSAVDRSPERGLELRHLPDTVYDRGTGKSRTNRDEARAVVEAVVEHFQRYGWGDPDSGSVPSLGIGTFSVAQQKAIDLLLHRAAEQYPQLEKYLNREVVEYCFIKNLETIQGDERDVIFISVGYGRDRAGKLTLSFGPLNAEEGWRRLNVLITRARQKCVVFSNFTAADLPMESTTNPGVSALRTYLQYAQTRELPVTDADSGEPESPFEEAVYDYLRDLGYEVKAQVGCAGYRVDLGVVDPSNPGRYLLGVECDGASYHSSLVARDRDRLRQNVLENLGWQIHRVWSTDWYRSRGLCEDRIKKALADATDSSRKGEVRLNTNTAAASPRKIIRRRQQPAQSHKSTRFVAPAYRTCGDLEAPRNMHLTCELHECSSLVLGQMVEQVVAIEAPVHFEEVVTRLRKAWGLRRAGTRIRLAVKKAVRFAVSRKSIIKRGDFLWRPEQSELTPRRRSGEQALRIELICDEELAAAMHAILADQLATPRTELIRESAKLLGYQAVHSSTAERFESVLDMLLECGDLTVRGDGLIDARGT